MSPTLKLGLLGNGVEFQVLCAKHGGGFEKADKSRKRGGKGLSRQAVLHRSKMQQTLLYSEVKEIMEARSHPNKEVSF